MKKKKVAALLLTLGLAVSGNGMVTLAAEQGTEAPAAETKQEPAAVEKDEMAVSRIVSVTDYTGLEVTYDAIIALSYIYEVEDAVLTGVKCRTVDDNGRETLTAVSFEGNVELKQPEEGERYETIAPDVFGGNELITYVKLPAGVTVIAEEGFKGCTALKSVYLPSTVEKIGAGAFENCTAMTQICLPRTITVIGDRAFKGDGKLQTVQIKDAVDSDQISVGAHAFEEGTQFQK